MCAHGWPNSGDTVTTTNPLSTTTKQVTSVVASCLWHSLYTKMCVWVCVCVCVYGERYANDAHVCVYCQCVCVLSVCCVCLFVCCKFLTHHDYYYVWNKKIYIPACVPTLNINICFRACVDQVISCYVLQMASCGVAILIRYIPFPNLECNVSLWAKFFELVVGVLRKRQQPITVLWMTHCTLTYSGFVW